jgi:hypothetical protein
MPTRWSSSTTMTSPAFISFRITRRHETSLSFKPGKSPSEECSSRALIRCATCLGRPRAQTGRSILGCSDPTKPSMFSLRVAVVLFTPVTAGADERDGCNGSTFNRQRSLCLCFDAPVGAARFRSSAWAGLTMSIHWDKRSLLLRLRRTAASQHYCLADLLFHLSRGGRTRRRRQ